MISKTISHYKIVKKLGEGGMGEVYLAEDTKLKRNIAIKLLPPHLTKDKESRERFEREAQAAAALNHPNIVTVYEIGEFEDQIYISMEHIEGKTLKELLIENDKLSIENCLNIATQICEGLEKAHQAEIVHRDIKPANIIIDKDNQVKILDFGLAKLRGVRQLTKETSTLGTIHYMSPEQVKGEDVDHRSDIWSFGIILYEMITGQLPFKGEYEQAVIYSIVNNDPEMLSSISSGLKKILSMCFEKLPSKRYQQVSETIKDIKPIETKKKVVLKEQQPLYKIVLPSFLIVALISIIVYLLLFQSGSQKSVNAAASWSHSIAVLPFVDMSQEQDQEFFCDGMAEEILNALTHVGKLRVIARTSAFAFKGKNMDVRDIGEQLGIETLLEGSVRKDRDRLRVTAQLIRTSDGTQLWSDQFDRNLTDVFAIQDEIALAIVNQLKIRLLGNEEKRVVRRLTENLEAYHQYLHGRHILNRRKAEDIHTAITYFNQSLELDSLFVMGYIGLADAYALLPSYASTSSEEAYFKAKEFINKALKINDQVGEAYASLGWILMLADWDWKGAEQAFQKGMELNPGYATLNHWYGYLYMIQRKFDKALIKVKRALELDPLSPVINRVIGDVSYNSGQYEKAIPALKKCIELEPCLPFAHLQLSGCYSRKTMYAQAFEEINKEKACRGNTYTGIDYAIGMIYAREGDMEKARQVLRQLELNGEKSTGLSRLYFILGEKEKGYRMLEDLYNDHNTWVIYINSLPDFDQIRQEQRFQDLLKKIGF